MSEMQKNEEQGRYEILVDGAVAGIVTYEPQGESVALTHTEVDDAHKGQGLAGELVAFALDDLRASGQTVIPSCPFVATYIRRHDEYADLVAPTARDG